MFLQSMHRQIFSPMSGQQTSQYPLQIHKPFSILQCPRWNKNKVEIVQEERYVANLNFPLCTVEKFKFSEFLLDDKNATYPSF